MVMIKVWSDTVRKKMFFVKAATTTTTTTFINLLQTFDEF